MQALVMLRCTLVLEWDDAFEISWQRPKCKNVGMQRCAFNFNDLYISGLDVTLEPGCRFSDVWIWTLV